MRRDQGVASEVGIEAPGAGEELVLIGQKGERVAGTRVVTGALRQQRLSAVPAAPLPVSAWIFEAQALPGAATKRSADTRVPARASIVSRISRGPIEPIPLPREARHR